MSASLQSRQAMVTPTYGGIDLQQFRMPPFFDGLTGEPLLQSKSAMRPTSTQIQMDRSLNTSSSTTHAEEADIDRLLPVGLDEASGGIDGSSAGAEDLGDGGLRPW